MKRYSIVVWDWEPGVKPEVTVIAERGVVRIDHVRPQYTNAQAQLVCDWMNGADKFLPLNNRKADEWDPLQRHMERPVLKKRIRLGPSLRDINLAMELRVSMPAAPEPIPHPRSTRFARR